MDKGVHIGCMSGIAALPFIVAGLVLGFIALPVIVGILIAGKGR